MEWVKGIASKIITGLLVLGTGIALISFWRLPAADRQATVTQTVHFLGWIALVLALPWASMLVIGRVARLGSNSAGIALVGSITLIELILFGWMLRWHVQGSATWVGVIACGVVAAAYNLLACDWIAERFE